MIKVAMMVRLGNQELVEVLGTIEDARDMSDFRKVVEDGRHTTKNGGNAELEIKDPVNIVHLMVQTPQGPRRQKLLDPGLNNTTYIDVGNIVTYGDMPPRYQRQYDIAIADARRQDAGIEKASGKPEIPVA